MATNLQELVEPTLAALGYELVDLELSPRGRTVRIFMDKPGGITLDDCVAVSNHLTRVFTVENVDYDRLEVSSPGLDRPLKRLADYSRFAGQLANVRLRQPLNGRKKFTGRIIAAEGETVRLSVEGAEVEIPFADIDRGRLEPEI